MARIFRFSGYFVDNDKYPYEDCDFVVRASDKERFYQCLTCIDLEKCNLDEKSEDERGLCKEYRIDDNYVKRHNLKSGQFLKK